eukprot:gnl/MRDRNA2_/MRDRNA2_210010_c0_seq1.p1 gnl/MRDRNA2_/MRDRNA2_210010_c0~~gnl/MRDRNA2_/MRDRNA2_210010_c0_seq1.p1  ORF type:complete len:365 (+),score=48.90 gnl/MRDRNA2_/MRDRNA2_210010_c0_seq1:141-1097(+)
MGNPKRIFYGGVVFLLVLGMMYQSIIILCELRKLIAAEWLPFLIPSIVKVYEFTSLNILIAFWSNSVSDTMKIKLNWFFNVITTCCVNAVRTTQICVILWSSTLPQPFAMGLRSSFCLVFFELVDRFYLLPAVASWLSDSEFQPKVEEDAVNRNRIAWALVPNFCIFAVLVVLGSTAHWFYNPFLWTNFSLALFASIAAEILVAAFNWYLYNKQGQHLSLWATYKRLRNYPLQHLTTTNIAPEENHDAPAPPALAKGINTGLNFFIVWSMLGLSIWAVGGLLGQCNFEVSEEVCASAASPISQVWYAGSCNCNGDCDM